MILCFVVVSCLISYSFVKLLLWRTRVNVYIGLIAIRVTCRIKWFAKGKICLVDLFWDDVIGPFRDYMQDFESVILFNLFLLPYLGFA